MQKVADKLWILDDKKTMVAELDADTAKGLEQRKWPIRYIKGRHFAVLPWTDASCELLEKETIPAVKASPFFFQEHPLVEGRWQPMEHQLFSAAFMAVNKRCYLLSKPRTGKTGCAMLGVDYMRRNGLIKAGVLVITTVTTIYSVWAEAIRTTLPGATVAIVHGPRREQALDYPADFYLTNYDSCRISEPAFIRAIKNGLIDCVIIDELTHLCSPSSGRFKAINKMVNKTCHVPRVIGMTGSPANNPIGVFGMAKIVNEQKLPCRSQMLWTEMVTYQAGPERFMRRPRSDAPLKIYEALQPAVRYNKDDILDLPPVVVQNREYELTAKQKEMCKVLREEAVIFLQNNEVISAANGGVVLQKMLQIAQGFVLRPEGEPAFIGAKEREVVLLEAIAESNSKVVVFGMYRECNKHLVQVLRKAGYTTELIDGATSAKQRAEILHNFQHNDAPQVLVCQYVTVSFGVELSAADTMIFYAPPLIGGVLYSQVLERLSSVKQKASKISIIRLVGTREEKRIYQRMDEGQSLGGLVEGFFEDLTKLVSAA